MRMFDIDIEDCDSCGLILRFESGVTYSRYSLEGEGKMEHTIAAETGLLVPLFYLAGASDSEIRFIKKLNELLQLRSTPTSDDEIIALNGLFSEFEETSMLSADEKRIRSYGMVEKG